MKLTAALGLLGYAQAADTWAGGPTFTLTASGSKLTINAEVPSNMYFSIGFGDTMSSVDMVYFGASGSGTVTDLWGVGEVTPQTDSVNAYTYSVDTSTPSLYKFTATRDFASAKNTDYAISCGSSGRWSWAGSSTTAALALHDHVGFFDVTITDSCDIEMGSGAAWAKVGSLTALALATYSLF